MLEAPKTQQNSVKNNRPGPATTEVNLSAFSARDSRVRQGAFTFPEDQTPWMCNVQRASKARLRMLTYPKLRVFFLHFCSFLLASGDFSPFRIRWLFLCCLPPVSPPFLLPYPPHLRSHVVVDTVGEDGRAADDETHRLRPRQPNLLLKPPEDRGQRT